ncbi:unnamed protein product [Prunus brigantina]
MEFEDEVGIYYRSSYKPSIKKEVDETATSEIHGEVEEEVDGVERRLKELKNFDELPNPPFNHHFINKPYNIQASLAERIQGEWQSIRQLPPSSILVRGYTSRIDLMRAVIVGGGDFIRLPKRDKIKILGRKGVVIVDDDREDDEMITCREGPPYHQGLFFFDIFFPSNYPTEPPQLFFRSYGLDLNPNLPKNGKVLLDANLQQSNIWDTLVSIRELILVDGIDRDKEKSSKLSKRVFVQTWEAMLHMLECPPIHFQALVLGYFRVRSHQILLDYKAYADVQDPAMKLLFFKLVKAFETNGTYCRHHYNQKEYDLAFEKKEPLEDYSNNIRSFWYSSLKI